MEFFDLRLKFEISDTFAFGRKEIAYEFREDHFFSTDGISPAVRVSQVCGALSRQSQGEKFFMLGPIALHGICATNLSGESSGHPSMSSGKPGKIISHGYQRESITQHVGSRQQRSGLAHLRRFRSISDWSGKVSLHGHRIRSSTGTNGLCVGLHDHRLMSFVVSVGEISQTKGRDKTSYAAGFARQHPFARPYNTRESPRRQHLGRDRNRTRSGLCYGSGLCGLCPIVLDQSVQGVLCYSHQKQFRFQASLLSYNRQVLWVAMRPDHRVEGILCAKGLPGKTETNPVLGRRQTKAVCVFDQQLYPAGDNNRRTLSMPLASRIVFQMDQTALADQNILWNIGECGKNTDMDRYYRLCARGDSQEAPEPRLESLHNFTDFERHAFRENPHFTGPDEYTIQYSNGGCL
jgi:hypothetical protein